MNLNRIKPLIKRELTDIFRDKKTLFMMVVLPILLYPLMMVGMTMLMTSIEASQQETTYKVCMEEVEGSDCLQDIYDKQQKLKEEDRELTYLLDFVKLSDLEGYESGMSMQTALEEKMIHVYVTYEEGAKEKQYVVHYLGASTDSQIAQSALKTLLSLYEKQLQKEKIEELGLSQDEILHPISYKVENMSSDEQTMGNMIGQMLPMLIIVSILMGAMYPAIDVTAGEKERGTLETILTLPVTNFELIISKFTAVSIIACVSAFFNILSMAGAFGFMFATMMEASDGIQLNLASFIPAILFTILVMMFFALFVTAVCMCVCIFAKSFKEANNYITPVMLVFMFASFVTMIPNIELTAMTATIPIVNISLMIVKLFTFTYDYALFGLVLLSNVVYSLLAILVLARVYNSESVLFDEGMSSLKLFEKRSDMVPNQIPGIGDVILLLCVQLLLMFYIGTFAQVKLGFGGVAVTQAIILIVPQVYLWYLKADYKKVLSLKIPKWNHLVGAFVAWIGAYALTMAVSMLLVPFMEESAKALAPMEEMFLSQPLPLLVLVIAVMPAVGEELMFRGYIYGSLKDKTKNIVAILLSSALFGIYHMSLIKFFSTSLLGLFFVLVVSETGTIFSSMLMHFMNNFVSVLLTKVKGDLPWPISILQTENPSIIEFLMLLGIGVIFTALGFCILRIGEKKESV